MVFPRILRCLFTGTSGPMLSLGLGGKMPEVVRRTIKSVMIENMGFKLQDKGEGKDEGEE